MLGYAFYSVVSIFTTIFVLLDMLELSERFSFSFILYQYTDPVIFQGNYISEINFIPLAGCDDKTNKSSIYFLVVLSFHLELNISDYMKFDIFHRFDIFHQA